MTNYDEFKAIADDIAEMYANGYEDYAKYYSETFADLGSLSAISRISDRAFKLRKFVSPHETKYDAKMFTEDLKELAIDAILAIGEVNVIPAKAEEPFLEEGARYWCIKPWIEEVFGKEYTYFEKGRIYSYRGGLIFDEEGTGKPVMTDCGFPADRYLQKIIEKK